MTVPAQRPRKVETHMRHQNGIRRRAYRKIISLRFPYSVEDQYREYVGPRSIDRFPRFSSFDLQATRRISLPVGEKHLHARVGVSICNLFNHDNPRDVQNILASTRYGEFFNPAWREFRGKFVLEF